MSGPEYPRPGGAGSNAIGDFIIGVSPIGSLRAFDVWRTVISQYANSPILTQLIENFDDYVDPTVNLDQFFDMVMNIDTAQGWGLDVWGRIVGVQRVLPLTGTTRYFGFGEASSPQTAGFNQQPFYSGAPLTENFELSDSAFRTLIFAKALANISDGSIPGINQILMNLFPNRGNAYVRDDGDMRMTYRFNFILTPVERAIVVRSGALPKPVGVSFDIEEAP